MMRKNHKTKSRIENTAFNLLLNSVKFTPSGDRIDASADLAKDDDVVLNMKDNGIGIAAKDTESILMLFGQVRCNHMVFQGGAGLGLYLVSKGWSSCMEVGLKSRAPNILGTRACIHLSPEKTLANQFAN